MAALSESDLIKILGVNATAQIEAASESKNENPAVVRKRKMASIEGQEFTAMALMIMGIVLFISAYYTQVALANTIQNTVAGLFLVAGIGWYAVLQSQKKKL